MYIDPSFAGMLIQIIIAVAVAGGAIVFGMRKKISALFSKKKNTDNTDIPEPTHTADETDVVDTLSDND